MDIKIQKRGLDLEIKAICPNHQHVIEAILEAGGTYLGSFQMEDTYFNVAQGRLKFRKNDLKDLLIQYNRENKKIKRSDFLVEIIPSNSLIKEILKKSLGVKVVVKKERKIFILDNIRFHVDTVEKLGKFIEIEVRAEKADNLKQLRKQLQFWLAKFNIETQDLVEGSYSDLMLNRS